MNTILEFIPNLKILYLILIILVMAIINIILYKKNINSNYKYLINGISLILISLITNYLKDYLNGIFNLNFLSVKFYLIILIITNIIFLLTIKRNIKRIYRIVNYLLFSLITFIFIINISMIVSINLNLLSNNLSKYSVILLNTSIIIFIIYLTVISIIYIVQNLRKINVKKNAYIEENKKTILSPEELLTTINKEEFSIDGVECSIIFEDSIPENIIKNYHILVRDINAKLVNGYTLEENKMLKSICTKLQITNLNNIDLNNLSILNKITPEEYTLLTKIYEE